MMLDNSGAGWKVWLPCTPSWWASTELLLCNTHTHCTLLRLRQAPTLVMKCKRWCKLLGWTSLTYIVWDACPGWFVLQARTCRTILVQTLKHKHTLGANLHSQTKNRHHIQTLRLIVKNNPEHRQWKKEILLKEIRVCARSKAKHTLWVVQPPLMRKENLNLRL